MTYYDDDLLALHQKAARKTRLEHMRAELRDQHAQLERSVRELRYSMEQEQKDLEDLEGGFSAFFYGLIGKMDEKLDKEQRELCAARAKYDSALFQRQGTMQDLDRCEQELAELSGVEQQYQAALERKKAHLQSTGGPQTEEILMFESQIASLESQKKELQEAFFEGNDALRIARRIQSSLSDAKGVGTWDVLGGGLIADLVKHSTLDEAQSNVQKLQAQLRKFQTELADVTVSADLNVNIDGFLYLADSFFDGILADWAVLDQIQNAQAQVNRTIEQINAVLSQMEEKKAAVQTRQDRLREQMEERIVKAAIS